jgi:putative ABC transport system permease protein
VKRNALRKDTAREIKKSVSRFISIMLIIALGNGVFVGLKATAPSVFATAENYFNVHNLMDIQLLSTAGFDDDDVEAIYQIDGVAGVMPSYSVDLITDTESENVSGVVRVMSLPSDSKFAKINELELIEGRLPENADECVTIAADVLDNTYNIGDLIQFAETNGTVRTDSVIDGSVYKIVGIIKSPMYFSVNLGTTPVGNGSLLAYAFIPAPNFLYTRYTELFVTLKAHETGISMFGAEYDNIIKEISEKLKATGVERFDMFIKEQYQSIDDAELELKESSREADEQISKSKTELEDAKKQIEEGKIELAAGWDEYYISETDAMKLFEDARKKIDAAIKEIADGERRLNASRAQYQEAVERAQAELAAALNELDAARNELAEARKNIDEGWAEYNSGLAEYRRSAAEFDKKKTEYDAGVKKLYEGIAEYNDSVLLYDEQYALYEEGLSDYNEGLDNYEKGLEKIKSGEQEIAQGWSDYNNGSDEYEAGLIKYYAGLAEYEDSLKQYEAGAETYREKNAELDEANRQYMDGLERYNRGRTEYYNGADSLQAAKVQLAEGKAELAESKRQYQEGIAEYNEKKAQFDSLPPALQTESDRAALEDGKKQLDEANAQIIAAEAEIAEGEKAIAENERKLAESKKELDAAEAELREAKTEIDRGRMQLKEARNELDEAKTQLDAANKELADGKKTLDSTKIDLDKAAEQLEAGEAELEDSKIQTKEAENTLIESKKQLDEGKIELDNGKVRLDGASKEIEENLALLNEAAIAIEDGEQQLAAARQKLDEAKVELDEAETEYNSGLAEFNEGESRYNAEKESADLELADALRQIQEGQAEIDNGKTRIAESEAELQAAREEAQSELNNAKLKLEDSQRQIADAEEEYSQGQKQYDEAVTEAEKAIADGYKRIQSGRNDLSEVESGRWYVFNRDDIVIYYSNLSEDINSIDALAGVFPAFFLMIVALVCLSTMTRMIDEQRIQIGTYKALGYSARQIASKYIIYALAAGLSGSILGQVLGVISFPRAILKAYEKMYSFPDFITKMPWAVGLIALAVSLLCTAAVAWYSCRRELKTVTAALMRPKAPKAGGKIFLERIKPVWNRFSFGAKNTARNIFRSKVRMIMTIIGVAGCMSLVVAGFGLQDAISSIVGKQYGEIDTYDIAMSYSREYSREDADKILNDLTADTRIDSAVFARIIKADVKSSEIDKTLTGVSVIAPNDAKQMEKMVLLKDAEDGSELSLNDKGIIITQKLAEVLQIKAGDRATIEVENIAYTALVSGIAEYYVMHNIYMTPQLYEEIFGTEIRYNTVLATKSEAMTDADAFKTDMLDNNSDILAITMSDMMSGIFDDVVNNMSAVILIMIVSAGALAFVVVFNLTNINISERVREIATIKVLGFTHFEVDMYIFKENIILGMGGILFGIVGGHFLTKFIVSTIEIEMLMFGRKIDISSYVYAALLSLIFILFVNIVLSGRMKNISMVESLKAIE